MKRVFLLILLAFVSCSRTTALQREAESRISEGEYEAALDSYRKLLSIRPDSVTGRHGYAMLLSLRRVSAFSALNILEKLYNETPEASLRDDLADLYIDMGFFGKAESLLSPEHLSVEEFFHPRNLLLRQSLSCLKSPDKSRTERLSSGQKSDSRSYMVLRCMSLADRSGTYRNPEERAAAYLEILNGITDPVYRCRSLRIMPASLDGIVLYSLADLEDCRKNHKDDFIIQREFPVIPEGTEPAEPRVIFSDELRTAPYEGKLPEFPEEKPAEDNL